MADHVEVSVKHEDPGVEVDVYCTPCELYDNQFIKATSYCDICSEYLCPSCKNAHKRLAPGKIHNIVGTETHSRRLDSGLQSTLTETCKEHQREVIHYYCGRHDQICCRQCIKDDHCQCGSELQYIPDISYTMKGSQECESVLKEIQSLTTRLQSIKKQGQTSLQHLNNCKQSSLESVKKIRQKFERLEEQTIAEIDKFYNFECSKISEYGKECQIALKRLEEDSARLESIISSGDTNRMYVAVKKTATEPTTYNENVRRIHQLNTKVDFDFEVDASIIRTLERESGLGKLKTTEQELCATPRHCVCTKPYSQRKAVLFKQFDVRSKGKSGSKVRVFGIEVFPNRNVVMHCELNMVKVFDPLCRPLTTITLEACPYDMAVLDNNCIVVTMPLLKKLQFLSVELRLKKERIIRTNKNCYGVGYIPIAKGRLVVSVGFQETAEVQILNLYGEIKFRIHECPEGKLFSFPEFVTVGKNKLIYVTDSERQTITVVKVDGTVTAVYKNEHLSYPCGPAVDTEGNFYVGGQYSNNVHQVDSTGKQVQILLSEKSGIEVPRSLFLDSQRDMLYVPFGNPGFVRLYKLMLL